MIGVILRHKNELISRIIEGKIEVNRDKECLRNLFVQQMISNVRISSYTDFKRINGNGKMKNAYPMTKSIIKLNTKIRE